MGEARMNQQEVILYYYIILESVESVPIPITVFARQCVRLNSSISQSLIVYPHAEMTYTYLFSHRFFGYNDLY